MPDCLFKNSFAWHHHPKIYHFEVVAAKNNSNNVLADVMYVALHRRDQECASIAAGQSVRIRQLFSGFCECHCFFALTQKQTDVIESFQLPADLCSFLGFHERFQPRD